MPDKVVFLRGQVVNLCVPDVEQDVIKGDWHQWFNDYVTTKHLVHGVYPVSKQQEACIVSQEIEEKNSLLLTVVHKETEKHIGVISLKNIDHLNRKAEISLVLGPYPIVGAGLEAMALLTQHGFDRLNLQKIYAGQHEGLWQWINTLELIGYRIEGYRKDFGYRNGSAYGVILTGVTAGQFNSLKDARGGNVLLPSVEKLCQQRRRENLVDELKEFLKTLHNN